MKRSVYYLLISLVLLVVAAGLFIPFLTAHHWKISTQGGIPFHDPVLALIPARDVSFFVFLITYGVVISYIIRYFKQRLRLANLILGYALLLFLRMLSMTLLPLAEPENLVFLEDPFLNELIYSGEITTDLFFSGHVGLVFLAAFLSEKRWYYMVLGSMLAVLLLVQHIHYSIDVLAAVPFAYLISIFVKRIEEVARR